MNPVNENLENVEMVNADENASEVRVSDETKETMPAEETTSETSEVKTTSELKEDSEKQTAVNTESGAAEVKASDTDTAADIKALQKKYRIVLALIAVLIVIGMVVLNLEFKKAVSLQKAEYEASKALYDKSYEEVINAQDNWKQELADKQEALNKAYAELETIYAERQAEIDAEEARWNALSDKEKEAEQKCNLYNEMVSYLRANNSEYAKIYVDYAAYLDKNIFEIGRDEALAYTELYERKTDIEKQYMFDNGLINEYEEGSSIPLGDN